MIITDHFIRYVELKQATPPIAHKFGERMLPVGVITNGKIQDYETLVMILEECLQEWKIQKRQVRFLVPESFVIIRKLNIPSNVQDDEIKGYLYLELGSSIHLPFDEPVFDAVILSSDEEKKEILIFAAQEEHVLEYTELFEDVKLDPVEAEISPLALYRLYYHLQEDKENGDLLAVQFDINTVNICIFENHIPFFMHHMPVEFDEKKWEAKVNREGQYELSYIGNQGDLDYQFEDIYKEINRLMDFYRYSLHQGKKQVPKILLNGDHPMIKKVLSDFKDRFDIPIETISLEGIQDDHHLPYTHYLALGLALKGG